MAIVSAESVSKAATLISARGERPTVARVIAELGGGSPNMVLPHLNAWKDTQAAAAADTPEERAPKIDLPIEIEQGLETVGRSIADLIGLAISIERAKADDVQQALQAAAEQRIGMLQSEASQKVAAAEAMASLAISDAREEMQAMADQLAAAETEIAKLTSDLELTRAALKKAEEDVAAAQERARVADEDRRRSAEINAEQMRQIGAAHDAIDASRRGEIIKLEAKIAAMVQRGSERPPAATGKK